MQQQFAKTVYQKYQKRCFVLNKEIQKHIINWYVRLLLLSASLLWWKDGHCLREDHSCSHLSTLSYTRFKNAKGKAPYIKAPVKVHPAQAAAPDCCLRPRSEPHLLGSPTPKYMQRKGPRIFLKGECTPPRLPKTAVPRMFTSWQFSELWSKRTRISGLASRWPSILP